MTNNLNWRLSKLPTPDEVRELVKDKIITQEEARSILFKQDDEVKEDKTTKDYEAEIKFLRELVTYLSSNPREIVKYMETIPWSPSRWTKPYEVWCTSINNTTNDGSLMAFSAIGDSMYRTDKGDTKLVGNIS